MLLPIKSGGTPRPLRPGRYACKEMLLPTKSGDPTVRLKFCFKCTRNYNSCMICIATPEATQEYLHQCKQRYHAQRDVDSQAPLFDQPMVHSKMLNFHSKLTSLEFHQCTTCLERFPDLTMSASRTECRRCSGDKRVPKLYSAANNMNPGPVPRQLQVMVLH